MLQTAEVPLIDEEELARAMEALGEERLVPILQTFAATVMDEAWEIASAVSGREPERARRLAHAIKGAACNLCATRLARAAEVLETQNLDADALALLLATARETGDWIARRYPD
ncbi:HPt (histidine-containing phosphotransfer) domain-containing protein [Novosphingobium sp. PhB165]|uniref:Hpt domain-containing protein n=1 Tax=Novosphingobium sp. PhB165 TaxID=2485105 RepID=UPI0010DED2B3|nr:Hpt domain-containing protein [Novosphingobium sp. PhB165]TCM21716.1 HPt (histidine-containing phosphotransfer) domain-containing protein [Novosphingobium sp. PhB165]